MEMSVLARGATVFLYLSLAGLCVLVLVLAEQNREFRAQLSPEVLQLESGDVVADFSAVNLDGRVQNLNWSENSKERLLLVFTTTCQACQQNQDNWRSLSERVGSQVEIWGISLDPAEATLAYRNENTLPFPVLLPQDRKAFTDTFKVSLVPSTIHIGAGGRVQGAWSGTLSKKDLAHLKSELGGSAR